MEVKIFFFSCGLGNDLKRDFKNVKLVDIGSLRQTFPIVSVNDTEKYLFVNGIGIGIDAVICKNRKMQSYANRKKSYAGIAVRSFKNFRTFNLTLEIDDQKYHFAVGSPVVRLPVKKASSRPAPRENSVRNCDVESSPILPLGSARRNSTRKRPME